jgi:predicted amidohydrolase
MKMRVSLGQMDVHLGQPERNLETVRWMVAEAAQRGSDLVVFPELWSTGYDLAHGARYATGPEEGMFAEVAELAAAHGVAVLGSCLGWLGEGIGNTAVYVDAVGQVQGVYSKAHLFRLMDEDRYLVAGNGRTLAPTVWGQMGLAICYDLRFPELFRAYALAGATAVLLPAEWPHPRLAHWRTLLRARAIENQMYVIACNRVGESNGTTFFGHSCVIDPWGETVVEGGEDEGLLTADVDAELVAQVRAKIPVFQDRRPELYG